MPFDGDIGFHEPKRKKLNWWGVGVIGLIVGTVVFWAILIWGIERVVEALATL